jgi:hypothetical protein
MSLSRSEQARLNGAKSHGPKTAAGKTISSLNALKHGRFCKPSTHLFFESGDDYQLLLDALIAQFRPATLNEHFTVERLAAVQFAYDRAALCYTTYIERLLRYSANDRITVPPTHNPIDTLVAAEEESVARSPYLRFLTRRMSQLLADQNRLIRTLKTLKRDFPPASPDPAAAPSSDPGVPELVETAENFAQFKSPDIFPSTRPKSTTSKPPKPPSIFETNPMDPYTPPGDISPEDIYGPQSPPNPHPKAA